MSPHLVRRDYLYAVENGTHRVISITRVAPGVYEVVGVPIPVVFQVAKECALYLLRQKLATGATFRWIEDIYDLPADQLDKEPSDAE